MDIVILLFDRFTALDAVGPYEVFRSIPEARVRFVARQRGEIRNDVGSLGLVADHALEEITAADILVVPGGPGQTALMDDTVVLGWIRRLDETTRWTTSICTGSLILTAAGLLKGVPATSHWLALDMLKSLGAEPVTERVVIAGKIITAAGVSAGIDMALTLTAKEFGPETAQAIQLALEYDPHPPFDAGSPRKAPAEIVERLRDRSRFR